MSDPQSPKPRTPQFEVPDLDLGLDLEPVMRSSPQASVSAPVSQARVQAAPVAFGTPDLFDDDALPLDALSLEVDRGTRSATPAFAGADSFDDLGNFDLEPVAQPDLQLGAEHVSGVVARKKEPAKPVWPTGRAPDITLLKLDPVEVAILADYGAAPKAVQLTPSYALRVFTRQRELKQQLGAIVAECERAEQDREATLAELARAMRPAAEQNEQFRRIFAPLMEIEQVASQRGQALSSVNAQQDAQNAQLDAELVQIQTQRQAEQLLEQGALHQHGEKEAAAKRAEAKLKRVHIEMRAVTQVAEQKLGPRGGQIPDAEAAQLATLRARAQALEPEVLHAQAQLAQAKQVLGQSRARLDALQQSERLANRKKQALGQHFQKELQARSQGLSESEAEQRSALADVARAVLGAGGSFDVPATWLERVRNVSERADKAVLRRELQLAAIDGYDRERAGQGVRLAATALGLIVLLIALKLIF